MDFGWILDGFGEEFRNNLRSHSFLNKVRAYLRTATIFLQLHKKHKKNLGFSMFVTSPFSTTPDAGTPALPRVAPRSVTMRGGLVPSAC